MRAVLCKMRISSHKLAIETGRHHGLDPLERICKLCDTSSIENELHFLIHCPAYSALRNTFYGNMNKEILHFDKLSDYTKLLLMLNSSNVSVLKYTIKFISDSLSLRNATR